ncbi:hypothetical protein Tco_1274176 [Tanacetum coccineum]
MKTKKDIGNMTIAEYMEYEARMKRHNVCPTRCEDADFNCFRNKSVAMEYPYYSDNSKIDLYYVLPPLLPCFQPTQTHTNYGHEYTYKDFREDMGRVDECESDMEEQELKDHTNRTVTKEVLNSSINERRAIFANKGTQVTRTKELQEVSFVAADDVLEGDILSKFLLCQLPPKELNLGSFTLLFEMADMTRKAPFGIVENILIDVFNKEISLGIEEDNVLFDMDGGMYHSKIPVEKVYMENSIQDKESFNPLEIGDDLFSYKSPACLIFEQCTRFRDDESIDTVDSSDNMLEPEVEHKNVINLENITSRWHVCKLIRVFYDNESIGLGMWHTLILNLAFVVDTMPIYE